LKNDTSKQTMEINEEEYLVEGDEEAESLI